jgi:hypothetical protein
MKHLTLVVVLALTFIGISLTVSSAMAMDGRLAEAHERKRFRADLQTTSRLVQPPPPGRCGDQPRLPPVVGLLEVVGAGDATFLGPVVVEQSHCVREDGSFFGGVFRLTNADGRTIRGRYFGHLESTFNSTFPPPAPGGPWLINGNVCISGGSGGDIDNDCSVHRYEPARGITNLSTGDATIFLDQTIGID